MKDEPRVAILFHGKTGSCDRNGAGDRLDPSLSYTHFKKHILDINNNVDVFIHCWDSEEESILDNLYKPVSKCFEEQVIFDFEYIVGDPDGPGGEINRWKDGKFKGLDSLRFHSMFSRWYSALKVNHMKRTYEINNDFRYDLVMLVRLDLAYQVDFNFKEFDSEFFYTMGPASQTHGLWDFWFISNSYTMDFFTTIYENLKRVDHFPHKFYHSHKICLNKAQALGLDKKIRFFGEHRQWGMGNKTRLMGPTPLIRDFYKIAGNGKKEDDSHVSDERDRIRQKSIKKFGL